MDGPLHSLASLASLEHVRNFHASDPERFLLTAAFVFGPMAVLALLVLVVGLSSGKRRPASLLQTPVEQRRAQAQQLLKAGKIPVFLQSKIDPAHEMVVSVPANLLVAQFLLGLDKSLKASEYSLQSFDAQSHKSTTYPASTTTTLKSVHDRYHQPNDSFLYVYFN